ncbi:hypothetical protein VTL71DRAFT_8772 [Oculimacula yallundae]|uniref:Metacaspase n=1 Tax=Oculimacula yallundae TaxID=86028 RepID=A0ABR4CYP9_9HELO
MDSSAPIQPTTPLNGEKIVHFLFLHFVEDDTRSWKWMNRLRNALLAYYDIGSIEFFAIPSENAHQSAQLEVWKFRTLHADDASVLCVYYSGHGDLDDEGHLQLAAGPVPYRESKADSPDTDIPTVDWCHLQLDLIDCASDVLIIMDCCSAGAAVAPPDLGPPEPDGGATEFLLSCKRDEDCYTGTDSFTGILIRTLVDKAGDKTSFTIEELCFWMARSVEALRGITVHWQTGPYRSTRVPIHEVVQKDSGLPIYLKPKDSEGRSSWKKEDWSDDYY